MMQNRPAVSVSEDPVLWWQHAGRAVLFELQARMRLQSGLQNLEQRRTQRLLYTALYSIVHKKHQHWQVPCMPCKMEQNVSFSSLTDFLLDKVAPNASLWDRVSERSPSFSVSAAKRELSELEQGLSVQDIAQFRWDACDAFGLCPRSIHGRAVHMHGSSHARRFMAACKHNSKLSSDHSLRVALAQLVGSIASSPRAWAPRLTLLNFVHGIDTDLESSGYIIPHIHIALAKVVTA